ncbi:Hypothetical predicted protein [Cloeon dipterum]|uniref:Uncharacterized protein n=1 Tax=Cloeon dipterum TaxID=197152 RepID=A0A8S1E3H3_9INSE|nr:Hypothetical predicted protein [Cloeon dipterum]
MHPLPPSYRGGCILTFPQTVFRPLPSSNYTVAPASPQKNPLILVATRCRYPSFHPPEPPTRVRLVLRLSVFYRLKGRYI